MSLTRTENKPVHPGLYVKEQVIPKGMTVTKAATILGVGRPALSNFLNGKAALSPDMAERLARAFGADRQALLDLQGRFANRGGATKQQPVVTGTHAPSLASIKAHQLEAWADRIAARQELPVLLRRLVHSTGRSLTYVEFPGYDNAERGGWDGVVETTTPTPWIPDGKSVWEFGCDKNVRRKANDDYTARVKNPWMERINSTFIFVTPRNWPGKKAWAQEKAARGDWKDVRAYDASDLEQWIEQSAQAQVWFAERLALPIDGYRTIDQCWSNWAEVCNPVLSQTLFELAVDVFSTKTREWLNSPPDKPLVVVADSRDEALAFLACLSERVQFGIGRLQDSTIVIDTPEALQRFGAESTGSVVAVIHDPAVETQMGGLHRKLHCIVATPRDAVNPNPDIHLGLLDSNDFETALQEMGLSTEEIERLAHETARSRTILRRRLSNIPAVCTPCWAQDAETARKLLPAAMVGAWHKASAADREILRLLANGDDYSVLENNVAALQAIEDSPLWSVGEFCGTASRTDALFGIAKFITETDLENFFLVAEYVLSEKDPAIDLPENERLLADLYRKVRNHSAVLRRGVRETLIILAVHGERLFKPHLAFNSELRVTTLVRRLLRPLDREKILSHNDGLPDYAEAAPEEVLSLLEDDLRQSKPLVRELMRPAALGTFNSPLRSHLLWALEGLAWDSQRFPRVVEILAQLCTTGENGPKDCWVNTPENTLASLFRFWWPQTSASLDDRICCFEKLCRDYPAIGWSMCVNQLPQLRQDFASPNHRPRWRSEMATAAAKVGADGEQFLKKVRELTLNWPRHNEDSLADLVQRLEFLSEADQLKVWDSVDQWAGLIPSEEAKAVLRTRILGCSTARRQVGRSICHIERERTTLETLLPRGDIIASHAWLFKSHWVALPNAQGETADFDYGKNEQKLRKLRLQALRQIWRERGFNGIATMLARTDETSYLIGSLMAESLVTANDITSFVKSCLGAPSNDDTFRYRNCLAGFLSKTDPDRIAALVTEIEGRCGADALLTLLFCLPFRSVTWRWLVDRPKAFWEAYWMDVSPQTFLKDVGEDEVTEAIDGLLEVHRPTAAFAAVRMMWDKVETSRLTKLLGSLATTVPDDFVADSMTYHYISKAFDSLDKRPDVEVEEKAPLEFAFFSMLEHSEHGIPNVKEWVSSSPTFFAQMIACLYKHSDGKEDPPELKFANPEQQSRVAKAVFRLLEELDCIPVVDSKGNIDSEKLNDWLDEVRALCALYSRTDMGDHKLGELLSHAPEGVDGIWPCPAVCEALERIHNEHLEIGFLVGTLNNRGVYRRAIHEGGDQERDLAERYRSWAGRLAYRHPYVSRLLEQIAASYDSEAGLWDTRSDLRRRLPYV